MKNLRLFSLFFAALLCAFSAHAQQVCTRSLSGVNYVTAATYPFVAADTTRVTDFNNGSGVTATLISGISNPVFGACSEIAAFNAGIGTVTINCTGCTINGQGSLSLPYLQSADIYGDGINFVAFLSGSGSGPSSGAVLLNPSSSSPNIIMPALGTQGLIIQSPSGESATLDEFQLLDPFGNQQVGFEAGGNAQFGPNTEGPALFNVGGGVNPGWLMDCDPYGAFYGLNTQIQMGCVDGDWVVWFGGVNGQAYTAPWMTLIESFNAQANDVLAFNGISYYNTQNLTGVNTTGSAGGISGNYSGNKIYASPANGSSGPLSARASVLADLPACYGPNHVGSVAGSSDQLTAAGVFATTLSLPGSCLQAGSLIDIRGHGVYTTTSTASPQFNLRIDAGGTASICPSVGTAITPAANQTNGYFDFECIIQINTTGSGGTAVAWGKFTQAQTNGTSSSTVIFENPSTGTVAFNTSISETASVHETGVLVTGQTYNLTALDALITP